MSASFDVAAMPAPAAAPTMPPMIVPRLLPPTTRPRIAPAAAPAPTFAASPVVTPRPCRTVSSESMWASRSYLVPRIVALDTESVSVPGSLGLGAGLTAVTVPLITAPAGITTCPRASLTSSTTLAENASPAWFVRELIVSVTAMSRCVPAAAV